MGAVSQIACEYVRAERCAWSDDVRDALSGCGTAQDLDDIESEVRSGTAQLWYLTGYAHGYVVTRMERYPSGRRELVIVMGAGTGARAAIKWAERLAHQAGADSIRTHIQRRGLERIYQSAGWYTDHIIMKRDIHDGQ